MPPRRAVRAASSTPSRTLQSAAKPPTQANTPGRTSALESTPLPDIEAEQSFAYGSSNTKLLPQQLFAVNIKTNKELVEKLDADVRQAQKNFQAQDEAAKRYGKTSQEARDERAFRRSSTRESRESSVESDQRSMQMPPGPQRALSEEQTPIPKPKPASRRLSSSKDLTPVRRSSRHERGLSKDLTRQWLQEIPEEASVQEEVSSIEESNSRADQSTQAGTHDSFDRVTPSPPSRTPPPRTQAEQSTMPEATRFDQTYTQERDLHVDGAYQPPIDAWGKFSMFVGNVRDALLIIWGHICRYLYNYTFDNFLLLCRRVVLTICAGLLVFVLSLVVARWVCDWYCETPWSTQPSRPWHHRVNEMCKYSTNERWSGSNGTAADTPMSRASAYQIARLIEQIKHQEKLVGVVQEQQSLASATIEELNDRHSQLSKYHSEVQSKLAEAEASQASSSTRSNKPQSYISSISPLFKRINYASPSLGAVIDPYLTSPTKAKHFPFYQRLLLGSTGLKKYQSRPAVEALNPWNEIGDCWCAAAVKPPTAPSEMVMDGKGGRYVQVGIHLSHDIFPDEIVIEHLPLKTTPSAPSAPKDMELWADFRQLTQAEFAALQMGPHGLKDVEWYPQLGLLGRFKYSAEQNEEGQYVQIFRLQFNQNHQDEFWTKKVVLRVNTNWGGENTCLYRVRVHGVPVHAHPEISREGPEADW